jgi:hypothetical protein
MTGRKQKGHTVPPQDAAAATPFFARFLEDQHGGGAKTAGGPNRQTLKYPSDRDEIDPPFAAQHGNAAGAS